MSETVYSKEAVDEYFAGLFEILATIMGTLVEAKIEDGASREGAAEMLRTLANSTVNAAARGFYDGMAERTLAKEKSGAGSAPVFTVIDGGKQA
jgi:alkyl sulfatase BDS1-like metallo-beta-lactamase superfamily hydrolase